MKNKLTHTLSKGIILLASLQFLFLFSRAQVNYTGTAFDLIISGTSTLHDWDMKSAKGTCTAAFTFNNAGKLTGLSALSFSTPANSLKSDHSSMDKNAYKALKTDKSPVITYTLNAGSVAPAAAGMNTILCKGKLTIAGATVNEEVAALGTLNSDGTITVTGSSKISMKDFNMEPPTFMMGTIKTGNDVVLKFNITLKKS
jgi:YceI-like domain